MVTVADVMEELTELTDVDSCDEVLNTPGGRPGGQATTPSLIF